MVKSLRRNKLYAKSILTERGRCGFYYVFQAESSHSNFPLSMFLCFAMTESLSQSNPKAFFTKQIRNGRP